MPRKKSSSVRMTRTQSGGTRIRLSGPIAHEFFMQLAASAEKAKRPDRESADSTDGTSGDSDNE